MKLVNSKIFNPFTLEFRDKSREEDYINSFLTDYARNSKLVIAIAIFLGFITDLSRKQDAIAALVSNSSVFIFGFLFIFFSYIKLFRNIFNILTFSCNLVFSYLAVTDVIKEDGSSLEVLQIIICFTIFPRSYFKYSIIANLFTIGLYSYFTQDIQIDSRNVLAEVLFFLSITVYVGLAAYLKEYANRNDYLTNQRIAEQEEKSNQLLLNILPAEVANELKKTGSVKPVLYENVSILFTDFKGFTKIAEKLKPEELLKELDGFFFQFDEIAKRYNLEKLKTIGDAYMCAGGIPIQNSTHAIDACLAALEIIEFMRQIKEIKASLNLPSWEIRIGIHSGSVVGGVIGKTKFAYDIWGDTVNLASRMESSGDVMRLNISDKTYELIKDLFDCEYRGELEAKNKGKVKMYFVNGIKSELSVGGEGRVPNDKFNLIYGNLY